MTLSITVERLSWPWPNDDDDDEGTLLAVASHLICLLCRQLSARFACALATPIWAAAWCWSWCCCWSSSPFCISVKWCVKLLSAKVIVFFQQQQQQQVRGNFDMPLDLESRVEAKPCGLLDGCTCFSLAAARANVGLWQQLKRARENRKERERMEERESEIELETETEAEYYLWQVNCNTWVTHLISSWLSCKLKQQSNCRAAGGVATGHGRSIVDSLLGNLLNRFMWLIMHCLKGYVNYARIELLSYNWCCWL